MFSHFVIAFPIPLLAAYSAEPISSEEPEPPPSEPSSNPPPAAAATCAEIAARWHGTFTADASFEVAGTRAVTGAFDDVNRLARVHDGRCPSRRDLPGHADGGGRHRAHHEADGRGDLRYRITTTEYGTEPIWRRRFAAATRRAPVSGRVAHHALLRARGSEQLHARLAPGHALSYERRAPSARATRAAATMAGGKHHYSSTFALTFQGPRTKSATMESESWEGWELTKTSDTEIVPPLGVGRHDGLEFFGYGAGSYCGDGFGGGGSSPFGFGQPVSLHFETPLHPPPVRRLCCFTP